MEETFQSKYGELIPEDKSEFTPFNSKDSIISTCEDAELPGNREKFNYIPGLNEPGINCGE